MRYFNICCQCLLLTSVGLFCLVLAGCGSGERGGRPISDDERRMIDNAANLRELTDPEVPEDARQILEDQFVAFSRIHPSGDRSQLLIDLQGKSEDMNNVVLEARVFDWKSETPIDVVDREFSSVAFHPNGQDTAFIKRKVTLPPDEGEAARMARKIAKLEEPPRTPSESFVIRVRNQSDDDWKWISGVSQEPYFDLCFSESGDMLMTVGIQQGIVEFKHWDGSTGELQQSIEGPRIDSPESASATFNRDGQLAAIWSGSESVLICNSDTGEVRHTFESGYVSNVAFSPDGRMIATSGQSNDQSGVHIWSAETGERLQLISTIAAKMGFSPDGRLLWTTSDLKRKSVADLFASNRSTTPLNMSSVSNSPSQIYVQIWDSSTGKQVRSIDTKLYPIGAVAFLSDSELMTGGSPTPEPRYESPARIYIWDMNQ